MTFLNLSLLAGSALIVLPIVLHLLMRQKTQRREFPPLRFVRKRHQANRRRMNLRHLLLLLLRIAVIALLALALARPSVKLSGVLGGSEAPVAAALVFDVAPHMQYRRDNRTRLEVAQELGQWLLGQLPRESQIAVLDTGLVLRGFDADRGLSKQRIQRLETIAVAQPLSRTIAEAAALLRQSDLPRKEIYVFTDLSRSAWPADSAAVLQERIEELSGAAVYLIDVGVAEPADFALGELHLSQQVVAAGGAVDLQTEVSALGADGERTVELSLLGGGKPQKAGEQTVLLKAGEARPVEFHLAALGSGTHQGVVRIVGQDALAADDARYFTVEVRPAWPVLVAAPAPAEERAIFLTAAISPAEFRKRGRARFDCHVIDYGQLAGQSLAEQAAVCLLDPPPLTPGDWQRLTDYVADGHGVAVFLGRNAQPVDSFNVPAAQQLLPGKLSVQVPRRDGDTFLAPDNYQHPILKPFASRATSTPWNGFPVFRYWQLGDLPPGAATVIRYSDGRSALVERPVGNGRVLLLTTPVSDRATADAWNLLPIGTAAKPWPFVILANQMLTYLVGGSGQQLDYFTGQTVVLPLEEQERRLTYVLTEPDGTKSTLAAEKHELTITAAEKAGNYRLDAGGRAAGSPRGFSVNLPVEQTRLDRTDERQLAELFGPHKFHLARTVDQIDRSVALGRVGRELYAALILAVVLALAAEHVVANRFYKDLEGK
jgi:hypothetical protein